MSGQDTVRIDAAKAPDYLAQPNVFAVSGAWMVPAERLQAKDWGGIATLARGVRHR